MGKGQLRALGAAESCRRDGFYADSVSRAYYAILHGAKAALQLRGMAAESHAVVKRVFWLHVVQPGLVEVEWGTFLGESSDLRLTADYDLRVNQAEFGDGKFASFRDLLAAIVRERELPM